LEGAGVAGYLTLMGFVLIFLGVLLIFIGVFAAALAGAGSNVEAGGVILIGPIPIILGTSTRAAILAITLAIIMIIVYIAMILLLTKR